NLSVREVPASSLAISPGSDICSEVQDRVKGESHAYTCGAVRVSTENTVRGRGNQPWIPVAQSDIPNLSSINPVFARGHVGAVYAYDRGSDVELRLLAPNNSMTGSSLDDKPLRIE